MSALFCKTVTQTVDVDVYITIEDIVKRLSKSEAEELIEALEAKHRTVAPLQPRRISWMEEKYINALEKLKGKYQTLPSQLIDLLIARAE